MVRTPCCDKNGLKKGAWTQEEDTKLIAYITKYGHWNWRLLPKFAGLARCGKSCRLRWLNYLRPDVKRGNFSNEEEETIAKLHQKLGNRWSAIAAELPGRTDNEIKNHWHSVLKKRFQQKPEAKLGKGIAVNSSKSMESASDTYPLSPQPSSYSGFSCITNNENSVLQSDDGLTFFDAYTEPVSSNFWTEPYLTDNYVPPECEPQYLSHVYDETQLWSQNDLYLLQECQGLFY